MMEQGRIVASATGYRYGFNGKEKDDEAQGVGNQIDYGARVYDPRVGRFLSVDPLFKGYPWYSPYQYAGNKPIWKIDLDEMEELSSDFQNKLAYQTFQIKASITNTIIRLSPRREDQVLR
jgi:RHS repeat-associated protein